MRTTAPRYIDATEETTAKLARSFKCTPKFVYLALTYRSDTETARKIRYTAVEHYGATPMAHYPQCETMHDTTENGRQIMRQEFDNGVTLRVDKQTGEAWMTDRRGEVIDRRSIVKFTDLANVQVMAENM